MILNSDFEGAFTVRDGEDEVKIAQYWEYGYYQPNHPSGKRPEWAAETRDAGEGRVFEGYKAQKWFWTHGIGQAWIWQPVPVMAGKWYELRARVYVWSSAEDDPNRSVLPGKVWVRLGANGWGDGNALSWATEYGGALVDNYDRWLELSTVFLAKANWAAVFLWAAPEHPVKHNDVYWDDVTLTEWECVDKPKPPEPPRPDPKCSALTYEQTVNACAEAVREVLPDLRVAIV